MKELRVITKAKIKRADNSNLKGIATNKLHYICHLCVYLN